jgi:AcrR family transcriptional regulator
VAEARRQLASDGASGLSLRAVARELGMAPSAVYRYFSSRDDLLTALIVEGYDAVGQIAEEAAATGAGAAERWRAVCRAVRRWALGHPQEYALLYGSPVPGYEAPHHTVGSASRFTIVMARLLVEAHQAGELTTSEGPPLPPPMAAEAARVARTATPDVPIGNVAAALVAWSLLFGQINFEVFGRFEGVIEDPEVLFEHAVTVMTTLVGLCPPAT